MGRRQGIETQENNNEELTHMFGQGFTAGASEGQSAQKRDEFAGNLNVTIMTP
jgi:hypothetical protein